MARQGGFYAVRKGRETGIFNSWDECKSQVNGYGGAIYKKFDNYGEAKSFVGQSSNASDYRSSSRSTNYNAVSYTHLDVYKRQHLPSTLSQ